MALNYHVHAMGCHYATFNLEKDAQEWAKSQSSKFTNCWWEVRSHKAPSPYIAYQNGSATYGQDMDLT